MERIWIRENGVCNENDLSGLLRDQMSADSYFAAYQTDRLLSGRPDQIEDIDPSKLLEIRIFDEQTEFLARRSVIKKPFMWRIADDKTLSERVKMRADDPNNLYPADESMYFHTGYQMLDVNTDKSKEITGEDGTFVKTDFMSTVGGRYSLPITKNIQKIKTKTYYSYDADGMVSADDFRMCSFEEA